MDNSQLAETAVKLYQQLIAGDVTEDLTNWLSGFYEQSQSIGILRMLVGRCENTQVRQHAAIGLKTSLTNNWKLIPEHECRALMEELATMAICEGNEIIRNEIISSLDCVLDGPLLEPLLGILQRPTTDQQLEAVVPLLEIVCKGEIAKTNGVADFALQIIARCFRSGEVCLRLSALSFVVTAAKVKMVLSLAFCWGDILALFDTCVMDYMALQRLTALVNSMLDIDECQAAIDCGSMFEKVMGMFNIEGVSVDALVLLFSVVDALCDYMGETKSTEIVMRVAEVAFRLVACTFDPVELPISQSFESTILNLVYEDNAREVVPLLWDMCVRAGVSDAGLFAAISTLKAMRHEAGEFYDARVGDVVQLADACIISGAGVVRSAGLSAITELSSTLFERVNHPSMTTLVGHMFIIAKSSPTPEVFEPLTSLLNAIQDTTLIFDEAIVILIEMIRVTGVAAEPDMLLCIAALLEGGAEKIGPFAEPLAAIVRGVLSAKEDDYDQLRVPAMRVLEILVRFHYKELIGASTCAPFYDFLGRMTHSPDFNMRIAGLSVYEAIFKHHPDATNVNWDSIDFPMLLSVSSEDLSAKLRHSINGDAPCQSDGCAPTFEIAFRYVKSAIHVLALSVKMNVEVFKRVAEPLLDMCFLQGRSIDSPCVKAGLHALRDVVQAAMRFGVMTAALSSRIVEQLATLIATEDEACTVLRSIVFEMNLEIPDWNVVITSAVGSLASRPEVDYRPVVLVKDLVSKAAAGNPGIVPGFIGACSKGLAEGNRSITSVLVEIVVAFPEHAPIELTRTLFVATLRMIISGLWHKRSCYVLGVLAERDPVFAASLRGQALTFLERIMQDDTNTSCQRAATVAAMRFVIPIDKSECSEHVTRIGRLVMSKLPLDASVEDAATVTCGFIEWLMEICDDQLPIVLRVALGCHMASSVRCPQLVNLIHGIIELIPDHAQVIQSICNGDEALVAKVIESINNV